MLTEAVLLAGLKLATSIVDYYALLLVKVPEQAQLISAQTKFWLAISERLAAELEKMLNGPAPKEN
jgi:hypothetical protein